jgi:histidyl-tRNA synthetase
LKAPYVLILGGDELRRGVAILRNMDNKSQEEIPVNELLKTLKDKIS